MKWPSLDAVYTDEFGLVDPQVYRVATGLWPNAERLALSTLGDDGTGFDLMLRSVAIVSRRLGELDVHIENISAFLWTTYRRLVLAELKKQNGRRALAMERGADLSLRTQDPAEDLDRKILIEQLYSLMDEWTRKVFELRALGYGFEMMERELGMKSNAIRARFSKQIERLRSQVEAQTRAAVEKVEGSQQ